MLKKLAQGVSSRAMLLTYIAGAVLMSFGASLAYSPAGFIVGGVLLIALVFDTGGRS